MKVDGASSRSPSPPRSDSANGIATASSATAAASTTASEASAATPAREDTFEGASAGRTDVPKNAGLPEELMRTGAARVTHGTDPGDFYCEHMFFTSQREADRPGSRVGVNAEGERLVGFLHAPPDAHTYRAKPEEGKEPYTQSERHQGARDVVGAAVRGYYPDAARAAGEGPVRLQLNGYDTFQSVKNNPTGDFVGHRENIDATMARAFGSDLLTPAGEVLPRDATTPEGAERYRYRVRDAEAPDGERDVIVQAQVVPVADAAIDGSDPRSVQQTMAAFEPHAVLSLGVAGGQSFRAEFHADDGGLRRDASGQGHDASRTAAESLAPNYSLGRAIHRGSQPKAVPVSSLLPAAGARRV